MKLKNVKVGMKVFVKKAPVDTEHLVDHSLRGTEQTVMSLDLSGHNQSVKITTSYGASFWLSHENIKKVVE
mgnify:CR=1 FL=1